MESDAMEKAYKKYYREVYLYALSLCRQEDMAEELVNEAFYKAFIASDIPEGSFKFWLFRVLKNQFIDFKRKESRLHPIGQFEAGFSDIRKEGPANKYITKERDERLYLHLVALEPEIYREVIFLFYYGDMGIKDIAIVSNGDV